MLILTIRTDKPEAEIGLYDNGIQIAYETWQAHRQLAETLHAQILELLRSRDLTLDKLQAIGCFAGPGSFTGLRIGLTVANGLAYALDIPIVAETGADWQTVVMRRLKAGESDPLALPEYGSDAHITLPKK